MRCFPKVLLEVQTLAPGLPSPLQATPQPQPQNPPRRAGAGTEDGNRALCSHADSSEPDVGLKLTNSEIMT